MDSPHKTRKSKFKRSRLSFSSRGLNFENRQPRAKSMMVIPSFRYRATMSECDVPFIPPTSGHNSVSEISTIYC
jgi:hypothetical protein